jgi:hypothetical protein
MRLVFLESYSYVSILDTLSPNLYSNHIPKNYHVTQNFCCVFGFTVYNFN